MCAVGTDVRGEDKSDRVDLFLTLKHNRYIDGGIRME